MGKYETKDSSSVVRSFGAASVEMFRPEVNIIQLLDETEQNIVIYQWWADQLFADAEGRGK